jgi:hypothetical protein
MVADNTAGNPLSAASLSTFMAALLPRGEELKNAYEAIALTVHAAMIAVGFRLIGLGDDDRMGMLQLSWTWYRRLTQHRSTSGRTRPAAPTKRVELVIVICLSICPSAVINGVYPKNY